MAPPTEWYRDNFLISTNPKLIQSAAVNEAFGMEMMYWLKPIGLQLLKKMLDNSLCFGVYELPQSSADIAGRTSPHQIGLARLVTDYVSTAYLTDVYMLPEYHGNGLGKWLVGCVKEHVDTWPEMRWTFCIDGGKGEKEGIYESVMGMKLYGKNLDGSRILALLGPGDVQH